MPYTREFLIGYIRFLFCIGFAFFSAGLLNSRMDTLTPRIQNNEVGINEVGINEVGINEVGINAVGINEANIKKKILFEWFP
jgi:hypothetical protein